MRGSRHAVPWGPITKGDFTFQGNYNPTFQLPRRKDVIAGLVVRTTEFFQEAQEVEEPRGSRQTFYGVELQIQMVFVMEGEPVKNSEFLQAFSLLYDILTENKAANTHPGQIMISKEGQKKLAITYLQDPGEQLHLGPQQDAMRFDGYYYEDRPIPLADIQTIYGRAMAALAVIPPTKKVTHWSYYMRQGNVQYQVWLDTMCMSGYIVQLTYGEIVHFLQLMNNFHLQHGHGVDLRGNIFHNTINMGEFNVELLTATQGGGGPGDGNITSKIEHHTCPGAVGEGLEDDTAGGFSTQQQQNASLGVNEEALATS